jgi:hypothetical protein
MTYAAIAAVERLVGQFGLDAVIEAVLLEAEHTPDEQLDALEKMIDALMAGFIADAEAQDRNSLPSWQREPSHQPQKKLSGS